MGPILAILGAVLISLVAAVAILVGGMRAHWPPAVEAARRLTMSFNRGQKGAGAPGSAYGLLRHVGRNSGTTHETPLGIERSEDGFVIAIVYGQRTQWVKNVLAAGSAEIVLEGQAYAVDRAEVVPIETVSADIPDRDQRISSLNGVREALRVYHVDQP